MNLLLMGQLVSERLDEFVSGPVYYPLAETTAALNEAQRFFCLSTLALERTATWSVPSYASNNSSPFFHMLTFFPDWIAPLRLSTVSGAKVRPSRLEDLVSLDSEWINSPGAPYRYVSLGADLVALYQQPAAGGTSLMVTYARAPVALVNTTDVPEIPAEYHPLLVDYAIYRLRQVEGGQEFAKTLGLLAKFMDGVDRYGAYVRARNKGARYDTEPFEIASYDRSNLVKLNPA